MYCVKMNKINCKASLFFMFYFLFLNWKFNPARSCTKCVNHWLCNKEWDLHIHVLTQVIYKKTHISRGASSLCFSHFPFQGIFFFCWVATYNHNNNDEIPLIELWQQSLHTNEKHWFKVNILCFSFLVLNLSCCP